MHSGGSEPLETRVSHISENLRNDLDLAMSSGRQVRAAVGGIAYTHPDLCPCPADQLDSNGCCKVRRNCFGKHVTIAHSCSTPSDCLFTVYAHLKEIKRGINGQMVKAGDVIGEADCTGWSTGNHLHFGLHRGDPRQGAGSPSISVQMDQVLVNDQSDSQIGTRTLRSVDFVCGDFGHSYEAVLPGPVPEREIIIDGDKSDWVGITPIALDPVGDGTITPDGTYHPGGDILALSVTDNGCELFFLI